MTSSCSRRRTRVGPRASAGLGLILGLVEVGPAWAAAPPANCSHTSAAADGHTCGHGTGGPFASRVAIAYPHQGSPLDIQNVDPSHTLYTMLLSGESEAGQWLVSYKPNVAGTYAFYLDLPGTEVIEEQPYPFEARDAFGEAVPLRLEHAITACPGYLSWVKIYELDAERYHLVLSGEAGDNVQVAVEHLEGFPANLYIDADGDAYGRSGSALSSWCGAASGYSLSSGDCDDEDPLLFPNDEGVCEKLQGSCDNDEGSEGCPSGTGGSGGDGTGGGGASDHGTAGTGGDEGEPGDPLGGAPGGDASSGSQGDGGAGLAGANGDPERRDRSNPEGSGCSYSVGSKLSSGGAGWLLGAGVPFLRRFRRRRR